MHPKHHSCRSMSSTLLVACVTSFASLCALSGCDIFERGAPTGAQYLLMPSQQQPVGGPTLGTAIVMRFTAIPPFDGRQLLYHTTDGSWRHDAYNGFLSDPSDMICEASVRALTRSGRFTLVGVEGIAVRGDFMIDGVIESFYADYTDPQHPVAFVEIHAYLLDGRGGRTRMVAHMAGRARAPISGAAAKDVVDALSVAVTEALDQIARGLPQEVAPPQTTAPANAAAPKATTIEPSR